MRATTARFILITLLCSAIFLWSSFAIAAPHPTWNGDYQRTSFKNVSLKANSPYGLLPSHALLIEDHLYSYSAPVFDDTYMYIYLYDSNETAHLRAYRLSDIFSRSGDIRIPPAWEFKIPSKLSSYRNSVECYYGESVSIAHCGEASAVSAPSLFTWNGRKMLTIGIGVRIYVFDISGNTPALIAMGHLVNFKQPNAVHQISLSPLFASGWIFAGGWQGVFYGWSMSCLLQQNCVPGETYIGINLADIGLGGHIITSSPSYDPARGLVYWGVDDSGHLFAVRVDGQRFDDNKKYRILTKSHKGISSSIVVGPNGWIYWPDKVGNTYRMNPDTGQRFDAYCGVSQAARQGSYPRTIRNIAVAPHGVYAISDNRKTIGKLPLDFTSSADCIIYSQTDVPSMRLSSPVATTDGVIVAEHTTTYNAEFGYSILRALSTDISPLEIFGALSLPANFLSFGAVNNPVSDFQAPVVGVGDMNAIVLQVPGAVLFWTSIDDVSLTLSINGDPNWRKLIVGNAYTLNATVRNLSSVRANAGFVDINLNGEHIEWAVNKTQYGDCSMIDSQRARCPVPSLGPQESFQISLPITAISVGEQTILGRTDVRPENRLMPPYIEASLLVEVVDKPWSLPTYRDSPYIEHVPPYPSTTKEGGRVRAWVEYSRTSEKLLTTDTRSRSGHTCVARRETEYTAGIRVTYRYVDVDGSDLLWYSDVLRREVGKGEATPTTPDGKPVSDPQNHPRLIWHTPEVGFRYEGIGEVHFEVVEDRRIRIERWDCRENYEPIYEWRDTDGDGIKERVRVGERFVGYTRTALPTETRDTRDIVWTDYESISITSVGTIRNR